MVNPLDCFKNLLLIIGNILEIPTASSARNIANVGKIVMVIIQWCLRNCLGLELNRR